MCKLLIMAGLNPNNHKKAWTFASLMGEVMTSHNDDGLGYTASDEKGNIFGERWLFNAEAFRQRKERFTKAMKLNKEKLAELKKQYGDIAELEDEIEIPAEEKFGTFGNANPRITAITLHTRAASGVVCYKNVHPFVDEEKSISVIHNGFISNHDKLTDEIRSTCDSERILNQYIEHEVNKVPADIQNMVNELKGWFACGIFSLDKDNKRVLDVFRTKAQLGIVFIDELDTSVFTTDIDDAKRVCKKLGWTISSKAKNINENKFFRLDAATGKPLINISYTDTTYRTNTSEYKHWMYPQPMTNDSYHDAWEKRAKERREAEAKKQPSLSLVTNQDVKYTELEQIEMQEYRKAGYSEEDIQDAFAKRQPSVINNLVADEIKETKELIQSTIDKYNEDEAANDRYFLDKPQGLWIKRKHARQ